MALVGAVPSASAQADEARSLEEVRNTVINLLEALVQKGVMTREQAESMVAAAQDKASADAKARAQRDAAESDAVRVTYVPETVRKQIAAEVSAEVTDDVTKEVIAQAKSDGWGVPGALPEWTKNVRLYGDVRARVESDQYADDNVPQYLYRDYQAINEAGGEQRAGLYDAYLNTTEDRDRLVGRVRLGLSAKLGGSFSIDTRLASGNIRSPVSTNQTMGSYGGRWSVNVDRAAVIWNPISSARFQEFDLRAGRFENPFVSLNELVWDSDLSFEGVAATYALDLFGSDPQRMERGLFLTAGAFPLQELEVSKDDKWLYGAQLGTQFSFGSHKLRIAGAYFKYENLTGVRNAFNDGFYDYTAPPFMQKGNTVFDIRYDADPTTELYALAGGYELHNASISMDLAFGTTHVIFGGEYVENVDWDAQDVFQRSGLVEIVSNGTQTRPVRARVDGYEAGVIVGQPTVRALGDWRFAAFYRYLERDAVLDAFTDSDFHLGGTDTKGYQLSFDLGLSRGSSLRLRYLTADEIDGLPLGIDVWQLDFNGSF